MRDCHVYIALLGDARVSLPWPDCLWLSRHQGRRRCSQLGGGMVGRRPGLVSKVSGLTDSVPAEWPVIVRPADGPGAPSGDRGPAKPA